MLKILLLLLMISLPTMAIEMRDTSDILKRMHKKSTELGKRKDGMLKVATPHKTKTEIDFKVKNTQITKDTELVEENKKQVKIENELIWKNNSKLYISKKAYNIALGEYIELNYPSKVKEYNIKKTAKLKKQKDAKEKARKKKQAQAKARKQREQKALAKKKKDEAKKLKEQAKVQKTNKQTKTKEKSKNTEKVKGTHNISTIIKLKPQSFKRAGDFMLVSSPNAFMWQDNEDVKTSSLSWAQGMEYCESLTLESYDDWRLPKQEELFSIVDKKKKPMINKKFRNLKEASYWTNSDYKNSKYYAWIVNFKTAALESQSKVKHSLVRCVRDVK